MLLGFLISLLSVTYSVASSNSVTISGEAPTGSNAVYERSGSTGQKGQMTAGNSTTLQLTGWEGHMIDSVVLSMRSNTSQGAGSLHMTIGPNTVWEIPDGNFSDITWNGSYSTTFVNISCSLHKNIKNQDTITVFIEASKNSLYINSYTFFYSPPTPSAHTVSFISGLASNPVSIAEDSIGSGIILPMGTDTAEWYFLGWSEQEWLQATDISTLFLAGERYYPKSDGCLWAVYSDSENLSASTNCQSGDYVIVNTNDYWCRAMKGIIKDKYIHTTKIHIQQNNNGAYALLTGTHEDMVYHIDFKNDSTLSIMHQHSNRLIGYNGNDLSEAPSAWQYRLLNDGTYCFYFADKHLHRMLRFGFGNAGDSEDVVAYVTRIDLQTMSEGGFLLFPAQKRFFTSWPFGKMEEDDKEEEKPVINVNDYEYIMYIGNYPLHIKKGEKWIIIN